MIVTVALFFASIILAPWWLTVGVALVLLSRWNSVAVVVFGGVLMDLLYGSPVPFLFESALLYTSIFSVLALVSWYLHATMLE